MLRRVVVGFPSWGEMVTHVGGFLQSGREDRPDLGQWLWQHQVGVTTVDVMGFDIAVDIRRPLVGSSECDLRVGVGAWYRPVRGHVLRSIPR